MAGLLATLPAGFITDASQNKRLMLALLCVIITGSTLLLWFSQGNSVVALANRQRYMRGFCRPAYHRHYAGSDGAKRL
jgi:sugar phosphate permease